MKDDFTRIVDLAVTSFEKEHPKFELTKGARSMLVGHAHRGWRRPCLVGLRARGAIQLSKFENRNSKIARGTTQFEGRKSKLENRNGNDGMVESLAGSLDAGRHLPQGEWSLG